MTNTTAEHKRLEENYSGKKKWLKWGPYLSERQWGTVREDYSEHGTAWDFFPHDHARSRVYRWGEDGIAGISDEFCNICFSIALWNGNDSILKERLFGLTGPQGNHGEDVKELYYYLDSTPTHSYMKHLYKYPQAAYPYGDLVHTNGARSKTEPEYELLDTGIFNENRYFDVFTEYAKAEEEDLLVRIRVYNRGPEAAPISILPTLWLRNLWNVGALQAKPSIKLSKETDAFGAVQIDHEKLGTYFLYFEQAERNLFTENETNTQRLFGVPNATPFVKDSINDAVISNDFSLLEGKNDGTKFSPLYQRTIEAGAFTELRLRLSKSAKRSNPLKKSFETAFSQAIKEADEFYAHCCIQRSQQMT